MDIRQLLEAIMQSRQNNPQAWSGGNRSKDPNFVPNTGLPEPLNPRHLATGPLGGWGNDVSRTGGYNPPVQPATPRPNRPTPQTAAPPMVGPDRQPTGGVNARMNPLKRRVYEAMMNRGGWR